MADAEGGDADDEGDGQYGYRVGLADAEGGDTEDDGDGQDGDGAVILERPISIQQPWYVQKSTSKSKASGLKPLC